MPKRTLGLESIRYRPDHNRKKRFGDLTNIGGVDLLHLFRAFCDELNPDDLVDETKGRYLQIMDIRAIGRTVLVEAESGYFGEPGRTINVRTHAVEHERTVGQSATINTRLTLTLPPGGTIGLFGIERQGNSGAGPRIVELFRLALIDRFPDHSFDTETVLEADAWADGANLLAVKAVAYGVPVDVADGVGAQVTATGRLEQTFEPERGHDYLPAKLLKALRAGTIKSSDFMGFSNTGASIDDTFLTVSRDGRKKTFNIDQERVPAIRLVLNADGEASLTTTPFLRRCQDEARDYYQGMGLTWNESWRDGKWSKQAMAVKMATPDPAA